MKRGQTILEYVIFLLLITSCCVIFVIYWDKAMILLGGVFGFVGNDGQLLVLPFVN